MDQPKKPRARRLDASIAVECEVCGAETTEPRRGLCLRCYRRMRRGSPALGGTCALCGITDQRLLRAVRLAPETTVCLCHNCGWIAERYGPAVATLDDLRLLFSPPGNRRRVADRRKGDRRAAPRRGPVGDRRTTPRPADKGDRRLGVERRAS